MRVGEVSDSLQVLLGFNFANSCLPQTSWPRLSVRAGTTLTTPWVPGPQTTPRAFVTTPTLSYVALPVSLLIIASLTLSFPQNDTVNPSTYKTLDKPGYWGVHAIGEVWAELLWVLEQRLIAKHGYSDTLYPPSPLPNGTIPTGDFYHPRTVDARTGKEKPLVPLHGNTLAVQLVVNGMKLQQCRPGFFEARDAIIQADEVLTGGENFCEIWGAFAEKGLGRDARVDGKTPWGGGVRTNVSFLFPLCLFNNFN